VLQCRVTVTFFCCGVTQNTLLLGPANFSLSIRLVTYYQRLKLRGC